MTRETRLCPLCLHIMPYNRTEGDWMCLNHQVPLLETEMIGELEERFA